MADPLPDPASDSSTAAPAPAPSPLPMRLLVVSDSPLLHTGFARVAANLIDRWLAAGMEVTVWGIGQTAASILTHAYSKALPCPILPAGMPWYSQDNLQRLIQELSTGGYTHLWVMQDHFLVATANFPEILRATCERHNIRSFFYVPVDAPLNPAWARAINAFEVPVAYTDYGVLQIWEACGQVLHPDLFDLPHGVDTNIYHPMSPEERAQARRDLAPWCPPDAFLMLNVNAHQKRKDLTRCLEILAIMKKDLRSDARLLLHCPTVSPSDGVDLAEVGRQLGLRKGVDWESGGAWFSGASGLGQMPENELARLYNASDLLLSTSLGEGWGLSIVEAAACGLRVAVPHHTACSEIADRLAIAIRRKSETHDELLPICLQLDSYGTVLPWDNSRVRHQVDPDNAAVALHSAAKHREYDRRPLPEGLASLWSWDRIAAEWFDLFKSAHQGGKPKIKRTAPLYIEIGGGLGDVFNALHFRNAGHLLDTLPPDEKAVVTLITHCPTAAEIFAHHPNKERIRVLTPGYWEGKDDAAKREQHGLPPPGALWRLEVPEKRVAPVWHPAPGDMRLIDLVRQREGPWVVIAASAGLPHRAIPEPILRELEQWLDYAEIGAIWIGKRYDRHGRQELEPSPGLNSINAIDALSVPGAAEILRLSCGLITAHSAWNILGWHTRKPQLLLYPENLPHRGKDEWSFGWNYGETTRCTFEAFPRDGSDALECFAQEIT